MAIQRFRSENDVTRRTLGGLFVATALGLGGTLAWLETLAGRVGTTAVVFFVLLGGLFYLGLRLFPPRDFFDIDAERRTYTVTRNRRPAGSGPLDDLGPLEVRQSVYRSERSGSTSVRYSVRPAIHSEIELRAASTGGRARRKMEALARAWRLPCRSLGGAVRGPDEIDVPLHQRLRDDAEARRERALRPEWCIRVEPLSLGYAMQSTWRSWAPLRASGAILFLAVFVLLKTSPSAVLEQWRAADETMRQVALPVIAVLGLFFLALFAAGIRDTLIPGTVRVTDRGVTYRGSRMALREIEEVIPSHPIELIGDRGSLVLGETFCAPGAAPDVAHELQRLIIEVAEANPHARSA